MRGKEFQVVGHTDTPGITPACAGKRRGDVGKPRHGWDHPRVCGEKPVMRITGVIRVGSPPRVRGKVDDPETGDLIHRITPACAGKSFSSKESATPDWDHPRVCGEKCHDGVCRDHARGSPPRVRGKGNRLSNFLDAGGITPACAGKRRLARCCTARPQGSPPRVRGKVPFLFAVTVALRITPACAGKSVSVIWLVSQPQDHPRVCGEKTMQKPKTPRNPGSPPRVRGKGAAAPTDGMAAGITPACAGKRCSGPLHSYNPRDHPRVCGEKSMVAPSCGPGTGSPPRVRGKVFLLL